MARSIVKPGRPATWEDLEEVPEGFIGEIVNGEIVVRPRPDLPHARAVTDICTELLGPFRKGAGGPGGWMILFEPRIRFGEEIRVPDLAGWRKERWRNPPRRGPIPIIPDWVCEVLSRSTESDDRAAKVPLYGRHGVRHLWLVNPHARLLEVYRLEEKGWLLVATFSNDERVRAEPFDAIAWDLALLWLPEDEEGVEEEAEEEATQE